MLRRGLLALVLQSFCALSAAAQGFQSQFTELKYDRAKAPATLHGNLQVDHASGSASFDVPMGPGMGARGLKYVPTFRGRWSPQVQRQAYMVCADVTTDTCDLYPYDVGTHSGGFTFDADAAEIVFPYPGPPPGPTQNYVGYKAPIQHNTYTALDGSSSIFGFGGVTFPGDPAALISAFGFTASKGWAVAPSVYALYSADHVLQPPGGPMTCSAKDGAWVIGLSNATSARPLYVLTGMTNQLVPNVNPDWNLQVLPSRILVVKGDLAYEYGFLISEYSQWQNKPTVSGDGLSMECFLEKVRFGLLSVTNRAGDKIVFSPSKIEWVTPDGTVQARFVIDGGFHYDLGEIQPAFTFGLTSIPYPNGTDIATTVTQPNSAPRGGDSTTVISSMAWKYLSDNHEFQLSYVQDQSTQLRVDFDYVSTHVDMVRPGLEGVAPGDTNENYPWNNLLTGVRYSNGHSISLSWDRLEYVRQTDRGIEHWAPASGFYPTTNQIWSYVSGSAPATEKLFPCWFWCVKEVRERDANGSTTERLTRHTRVVPTPDRVNLTWLQTAFYDAVDLPDGSSDLYVFASPTGPNWAPSNTADSPMAYNVYLKHQPIEIRHFPVGDQLWKQDVSGSGLVGRKSSAAWKIEAFDRFSLRSADTPDEYADKTVVPHSTRHRTWDKRNQISTLEEQSEWDNPNRGWTKSHHLIQPGAGPEDEVTEWLIPSQVPSYATPAGGRYEKSTLSFESLLGLMIHGRRITEQVVVDDHAPGAALGFFPWTSPLKTWAYDQSSTGLPLGRLATYTESLGGFTKTVAFTYQNDPVNTRTAPQSVSVTLTGAPGDGGVAAFGYDPRGILNSIRPYGATFTVQQTTGALGLALDQTDANGLKTTFGWDGSGRMTQISPAGLSALHYAYDADQLGVVVTRDLSSQWAQDRFNAFGEKILEHRQGNASMTSHRAFQYNKRQEPVAQSVWTLSAIAETAWFGNTGDISGAAFSQSLFDDLHRPTQVTDPNGVTTTTTYGVRTKSVQTGSLPPTHFLTDVAGRLYRVVDAKNQVSDYVYDAQGHVSQVTQWTAAAGTGLAATGTGTPQTRRWIYDTLGRLVVLEQPESGVTYYADFTVKGTPTRTVYGLPMGWRPGSLDSTDPSASAQSGVRTVFTSVDAMGRVKHSWSPDGSLDQQFIYGDESDTLAAAHGASKGKLVLATTGSGISRELFYDGTTGLLNKIVRTLPGLPPFVQTMGFDALGQLKQRTYPDGRVQTLALDAFKGVPGGVSLGGVSLATLTYDDAHWSLNNITWANYAFSTFAYDLDQTRLKQMSHTIPSWDTRLWRYSYDSANRLLTDGEDTYTYDELGRLTSATVRDLNPTTGSTVNSTAGVQQAFGYDAFGNRSSLSSMALQNWAQGTLSYSTTPVAGNRGLLSYTATPTEQNAMVASNHLPASLGGVSTGSTYDVQGNLTKILATPGDFGTQLTLTYDALGRVSTLFDAKRGVTERYYYDDEGLRAITEEYLNGQLQKRRIRIYNEARQVAAEYEQVLQ